MTKHPAQVDVAVLLLFFTRATTLKQVFEAIKQARPSRLFLYQDGPRDERDMPGIEACRQLVADDQIDWQCDVRRHYCEKNQGCDPSGYLAQRWAFSLADKCIVIEDDVVPSRSFFTFAKEMLDRYEHDERITMIAGFNTDEVTPDVEADYFFTSVFSIWGWASWRRVVDQWDPDYTFLDDSETVERLRDVMRQRRYRKSLLPMYFAHKKSGKPYFETIFSACMLLNNGLAVMPARNLVNNIGLTVDSTHYTASLETTPRGLRKIFTMRRFELDFPLKHPKYVIDNVAYKERHYRRNAWGHPWIKAGRSLEELWLNLRHGNLAAVGKALALRMKKLGGKSLYK